MTLISGPQPSVPRSRLTEIHPHPSRPQSTSIIPPFLFLFSTMLSVLVTLNTILNPSL